MAASVFEGLLAEIAGLAPLRPVGRVAEIAAGKIFLRGLGHKAALGDLVRLTLSSGECLGGEVIGLGADLATVLPEGPAEGAQIGDAAELLGPATLAPHDGWIGRVIDPYGTPLDGRAHGRRPAPRPLREQAALAMRARPICGIAAWAPHSCRV